MKTLSLAPSFLGVGLIFGIGATSGPLPLRGQQTVIVPARSSSSLDDANRSSATVPAASPPASPRSPFTGNSSVSRVTVPAATPSAATITSQTEPVPDPAPTGTVVAMQRVEPEKPPLDVTTIKRLSELRRDLRVAESAARARINLPADDLFTADPGTVIDPLALPALEGVVEYLERTLKKEVTMRSYYVPGEAGAKERAWARCLTLMDWLKANSTLSPERLTAAVPEPLDKAAPKPNATSIGETEYVSRIELHLE